MAAGAHFGYPKFTFDRISGHFRSIRNFILFWKFFTKWLPLAILDVWNSLSIAFLAILDQYGIFFTKWPPAPILDVRNSLSIAFLAISDRYATLFFRIFLTKRLLLVILLKFIFDSNSGHFRSIQIFLFFSEAILDVRKSLSIAFLAISDRLAILDVRNSLSMAFLAISDPYWC